MSTDSTIPKPRVIVLCFDGTSNQFEAANTNVVKFYSLLDKCYPLEQIVYYQPGIGTFFNPGIVRPALTWLAKIADNAFAWYLNAHVMNGYKFLMQNYRAGDKVCIFGFSRGAYTARALAGLLHKIGLLPRDNDEQISFAYQLYKREDEAGRKLAAGFKETFCAPISIDFLGVWDTVASVGLIYSRGLPFTSSNSAVRIFRHALALDEHRARFQPNMFHRESPEDIDRRKKDPYSSEMSARGNPDHDKDTKPQPRPKFGFTRWGIAVNRHSSELHHRGTPSNRAPPSQSPPPGPSTQILESEDLLPPVLEVWFSGCHADVGGSAVPDTVRYSLADISLRWMVKQVILSQCGIKFDAAALRKHDIDISTIVLLAPKPPAAENSVVAEAGDPLQSAHSHTHTAPNSTGADGSTELMVQNGSDGNVEGQNWPREQDVLADVHDELRIKPSWWFLEFLPMKFMWQDLDGTWKYKWGSNFGRGRKIRDPHPSFHESVRERMNVTELHYKPRAKWTAGSERYVD